MWFFLFFIFFLPLGIFAGIMLYEPRTLWCGGSFFFLLLSLAAVLLIILQECSKWLASHERLIGVLIFLFSLTILCIVAFPAILIVLFFIEGIKVLRHEGIKPSNLLSMAFSLLLFVYLAVWPMIGNIRKNTFGTILYIIISFSAVYILALMAMYSLSAILNLIHLKKKRNADYIIVLGSGIAGREVTPLLAARIERGIELLQYNPDAMLILSGGQGPGEDIPESEAMASYAASHGVDAGRIIMEKNSVSTEENLLFSRELMDKQAPRIILVTTAYHVFRALLLAKKQKIKCVGFGSKTKWYFTLNALLREFAGYLSLTRKKHAVMIGIVSLIVIAVK